MAAVALTFPASVFAANEWTGPVKLTYLENWVAGEGVYFKTDQGILTNPAACSITSAYRLAEDASDIARSMLLSAYIAGKPVRLGIWGEGCSNNRPKIVAAIVE